MEVEYTLCQIQIGQDSLATRTHRREGGDPRLTVNVNADNVEWRLENLLHGEPQTVQGERRRDRVDFYFLEDILRRDRGQLPTPTVHPVETLRLQPANSAGTERRGGRHIRMVTPLARYRMMSVEAFSTQQRSFHAIGQQPIYLHLDRETTPPGGYGQAISEAHFGVQASYAITEGYVGAESLVVVTMSHATYATIYEDLQNI